MAALSSWLLHLSSERGWRGGERQVLLLARGLAERGVVQAVAAPDGSPLAEAAADAGIEVIGLHPGASLHPTNIVRLLPRLWRRRYALLHAHTSPSLDQADALRRLAPAAGIIHTRRVAFPVRPSRKYRRSADAYVAISAAIRDLLLGAGCADERLRIIPSAVELAPIDSAEPTRELEDLPGWVTVGCVGQLSAEKGHATLLAAWAEVIRSRPRARLVLIGDGPERPVVEAAAARLPEGSVVLAGFRDDVPSWLRSFDLCVQPSLAEGLGSSVLDAMAARLAVVASRTGGLPEAVVHGETGLLVEPHDPTVLAAALLDLMGHEERRTAMGGAGRRRVEAHFSPDAMIDAYLQLYREISDRPGAPAGT